MPELKRNETNSKTVPAGAGTAFETRTVDISTLRPHPDNDYAIDEDAINRLADNIKAVGYLVETPLVREVDDGGLQIVSGHRRIRALKLLAKEDPKWLRQVVRVALNMSDPDALLALHSGNVFRPVSPAERARLLDRVSEMIAERRADHPEWKGQRTMDIVASLNNISRATAYRQMRYARNLTEEVWDLKDRGLVSTGTADELAVRSPAEQRAFVKEVERSGATAKTQVDDICRDVFTTDQQLATELEELMGEFDLRILKMRDRMRRLEEMAAPGTRIGIDVRRLERVSNHLDDLVQLALSLEEAGLIV